MMRRYKLISSLPQSPSRHNRLKQDLSVRRSALRAFAFCAGVFLIGALVMPQPVRAEPRFWLSTTNGIAVGGYDPLAYYTKGKALPGYGEFEHRWAGVVWRFRNPGNRDAFMMRADVYAPLFSGYDPYMIGKGIAVEGVPTIWAMHDGKLFFFQNVVNKYLWAENPGELEALAQKAWPRLWRDLPPGPEQKPHTKTNVTAVTTPSGPGAAAKPSIASNAPNALATAPKQ